MPQLIHVGIIPLPNSSGAVVGMAHAADYRDEIASYEILSADTGAACDICGLSIAECAS